MHRFFVENIDGETVVISGTEAHHLKNVLRKKTGDVIFLFDGKGNEYKAKIIGFVAAEQSSANPCSLIFWECEQKTTLKMVLKSLNLLISQSLNIFIGPESGFSNAEIELAKKHNITPVSLGKRILRTETAPLVVISNILYELEL